MKDFLKVRIGKDVYLLMERITSGWIPLTKKQIQDLLDSEVGIGSNYLVIVEAPINHNTDFLLKIYNKFGIQIKNNKIFAIISIYFINLLNLIPKPTPCSQLIEIDKVPGTLKVELLKKNKVRLILNNETIEDCYFKKEYFTTNNYYYNVYYTKTPDDVVLVYCPYYNQINLIQKSLEKNLIKSYILLKPIKDQYNIKKRGKIILQLDYFGEQNDSPPIALINNIYKLYKIIPKIKFPVQILSNKNSLVINYDNSEGLIFYLETNFLILQRGKLIV